jgi:hypothetical protein
MRTVTVLGVLSTIASIMKLVFVNFLLLPLAAFGRKVTTFFANSTHYFEDINTVCAQKCSFFHGSRYIMYGNTPEQLNSITNDEQKSFVLAVLAFLR